MLEQKDIEEAKKQELQSETLELQRIKKSVKDFKKQRDERNAFTYRMSRSAEIFESKKSVAKAKEFRQLVEEYILSRQ